MSLATDCPHCGAFGGRYKTHACPSLKASINADLASEVARLTTQLDGALEVVEFWDYFEETAFEDSMFLRLKFVAALEAAREEWKVMRR